MILQPRVVFQQRVFAHDRPRAEKTPVADLHRPDDQFPPLDRVAKHRNMFVHARAFADRDQVERGEVVRFEMHVLPDPRAEQAVNETHQRRPIEVVNVQRADQVLHEPPTQMVVAPKRIPARPNMPEHEPLGCDREEEQDREHHHRNPRRPRDGFER